MHSPLPKRLALVRKHGRIGARAWLPAGFVAGAQAGRPRLLLIRQLGRARLLALRSASSCSAVKPHVDWPHLIVEGQRRHSTVAVWSSSDGGSHWTRFGRC